MKIHLETIIHCEECRTTIEYFCNDDSRALGVITLPSFEFKARNHFVNQQWRHLGDDRWLCPDHQGLTIHDSQTTTLKEAA